jgi:hypothetical protein
MKTIGIIGGSQKKSCKQLGRKGGFEVLFHDGTGNGVKNKTAFQKIVEKADCIVVMIGAISHESMWFVKDLSKKYGKPITYHKGFGLSGAIRKGTELVG